MITKLLFRFLGDWPYGGFSAFQFHSMERISYLTIAIPSAFRSACCAAHYTPFGNAVLRFLICLLCVIGSGGAYAQIDTEFWFAPPEVTSGHGDRPVYLRISTLNEAANVRVVQPARNDLVIGSATVAANTTYTIDLTAQLSNLETISPATVMRTGIRVTSSAPVTAYYEVGAPWNADIFALKGANALGNRFVIPGQDMYHNSGDYYPNPTSSFDIVATRDMTVVKVRPTKPLFGHTGDTLITIRLNAGETYSFRKTSLSATDNPIGTVVESNRPIAITLKDDSVINGGCRDILGDQLVPIEVAGTEYVVLKGFLGTPEYVFVTATEDDTRLFIAGSSSPAATLSAGEIYRHPVTTTSTYITANKTIYVFHVTGFGCEMGLAILPSITCKGSPQIGFSRTTSEFFGLNILVRKEGIGNFTLNGSSGLVPGTAFSPVPGTSDEWYTAQLSFNTSQVPVGQASLITNSENSFQVGIINGNAASTCRYGYFSSFSTLFIGDDLNVCTGQQVRLDAGPGKESYLWSTGQTSQQIEVSATGTYWVRAEREECVLYDTVRVTFKTGSLDLGPDIDICRGDTARIDGGENFSWQWSDGTSGQYFHTTHEGAYWVSAFDYAGCLASDTIEVSVKELPALDLGSDIVKCRHDEVTIGATIPNAEYEWNDGATDPLRSITEPGVYWLKVTADACSATDSLLVENLPGPAQDSIYGTPSVCPSAADIEYRVDPVAGSSYQWYAEGGQIQMINSNLITVDWSAESGNGMVKAVVTDLSGCRGDTLYYPVRINVVLLPEIPFGPDSLCLNKSQDVMYYTPATNGSVYTWNISGGVITTGQGTPEVSVTWTEGLNSLSIDETSVTVDTVCQGQSPVLFVYVFKDTTRLTLNFVTADTSSANILHVDWEVSTPDPFPEPSVSVYRKAATDIAWLALATVPPPASTYSEDVDYTQANIYEYYLSLTNACEETLATPIHNNIFLAGVADTLTGMIRLNWNHYFGWTKGVERYEVWRKLDSEPGYRYLTTVSANDNTYQAELAGDGFSHRYLIRANEQGGTNNSWSNVLGFDFEHSVTIPNIITPNGDEFNQYFHIDKVELYRNAELTILDRWGKEVFHTVNYRNDWDGAGLAHGVYFYILDLKRDNKVYKGTLTIL